MPAIIVEERRASWRYPMSLDLHFRRIGEGNALIEGSGRTVNVSALGILFTPSGVIDPGTPLELVIDWPMRLDGGFEARFVVIGVVVRCRNLHAAIRIQRHEFLRERAAARASRAPA